MKYNLSKMASNWPVLAGLWKIHPWAQRMCHYAHTQQPLLFSVHYLVGLESIKLLSCSFPFLTYVFNRLANVEKGDNCVYFVCKRQRCKFRELRLFPSEHVTKILERLMCMLEVPTFRGTFAGFFCVVRWNARRKRRKRVELCWRRQTHQARSQRKHSAHSAGEESWGRTQNDAQPRRDSTGMVAQLPSPFHFSCIIFLPVFFSSPFLFCEG